MSYGTRMFFAVVWLVLAFLYAFDVFSVTPNGLASIMCEAIVFVHLFGGRADE